MTPLHFFTLFLLAAGYLVAFVLAIYYRRKGWAVIPVFVLLTVFVVVTVIFVESGAAKGLWMQ